METVAIVVSLALKMTVGRWGYSGRGDLPMLGDFEAQRHWMEVTLNLPIGDWYRITADNNLQYWGLDYPPLTAYVSWAFGVLAQNFYPNLVLLHKSKGHEQPGGKFFMRFTVLIADIFVLTPAILYSLRSLAQYRLKSPQKSPQMTAIADKRKDKFSSILLFLLCLIGPSNILIDHGHFQYNGVCIGLALLGSTSILENRDVIGSVFFCLALNFKQMALYYAPVFFFALLRKCLDKTTWQQSVIHLAKIGSTVILTFAALWWPFCVYSAESETCTSSLLLVLSRQFPFSRGIFEDKVSNLWYSASVAVDFRKYFSIAQMAQMSLIVTLALISPIAFDLMRRKINPNRMILSLVNCSMAFFLASFQVHEKSLLLPLIPSILLLRLQPIPIAWFQVLGAFTMFPMLVRDGLRGPYFAVNAIFFSIFVLYLEERKSETQAEQEKAPKGIQGEVKKRSVFEMRLQLSLMFLVVTSLAGMCVLHGMEVLVLPPARYPDLYPALFSLFGAANLLVVYILGITWQLTLD